jgi:hypothetical protein
MILIYSLKHIVAELLAFTGGSQGHSVDFLQVFTLSGNCRTCQIRMR